jgi:hypothetical protein
MKINTVDTLIEDFKNGREIFSRHSIELAVREILRLRTQLKSKEIVIESKQEEINKLAEKLLRNKLTTKEQAAVKVSEIIAAILSDHDSKYYLDCKYLRWGLIEKEIIDIINKIGEGDK